jgi:hypothetical protein
MNYRCICIEHYSADTWTRFVNALGTEERTAALFQLIGTSR